jgi:hypothetical protein
MIELSPLKVVLCTTQNSPASHSAAGGKLVLGLGGLAERQRSDARTHRVSSEAIRVVKRKRGSFTPLLYIRREK